MPALALVLSLMWLTLLAVPAAAAFLIAIIISGLVSRRRRRSVRRSLRCGRRRSALAATTTATASSWPLVPRAALRHCSAGHLPDGSAPNGPHVLGLLGGSRLGCLLPREGIIADAYISRGLPATR